MLKTLKQPKRIITEYLDESKLTILSNIDGHSTLKASKETCFSEGIYYEVEGEPEVYTLKLETNKSTGKKEISRCRDVVFSNKFDRENIRRGYNKVVDFELVKCVNLEDYSKSKVEEINSLKGIKGEVKETYCLNGVSFCISKLNKGQLVRYKNVVLLITDLIKPNRKSGESLTTIIGTEIPVVTLKSVYRLYSGVGKTLDIFGEYTNYGDALLNQVYLWKDGINTHL